MIGSLSCSVCRRRKVRCDRSFPSCDRCILSGSTCTYPSRRPRGPNRISQASPLESTTVTSGTHEALAVIQDRLKNVEAVSIESTSQQSAKSPTLQDSLDVEQSSRSTESTSLHHATQSPDEVNPSSESSHVPSQQEGQSPDGLTDISAALSNAVIECQRIKKRHITSHRMFITGDVSLPLELTKAWVDNYFVTMSHKLVFAIRDELFINRPLLRMMPELTTMEHVHIDASMLVIYYCVLQQGAAQTAAESLDMELSKEMHRNACTYAQMLNLCSIDRSDDTTSQGGVSPIVANDDRRLNMWNLIQVDLLYRLVQNESSALSFDFAAGWHVNLPSLTFDPEYAMEEAVHTMTFLARSRVALILINFFQIVDDVGHGDESVPLIVGVCEQVEDVAKEWKLHEWLESRPEDPLDSWAIAELALICYVSILFMLLRRNQDPRENRAEVHLPGESRDLGSLCPDLSLPAARKVIDIIYRMLKMLELPGRESLSSAFCCYRADVAFSHIVKSLIHKHPEAKREDIESLGTFLDCVKSCTTQERELLPLVSALEAACNRVKDIK